MMRKRRVDDGQRQQATGANGGGLLNSRVAKNLLICLVIYVPISIGLWIQMHEASYPLWAVSLARVVLGFLSLGFLLFVAACFFLLAVRSTSLDRRILYVTAGTLVFCMWLYAVCTCKPLARELSTFMESVRSAAP